MKKLIDIFVIWTDSERNLNKFLEDLNEFHPILKFTYENSKEKIYFLDLVIKFTDDYIVTDLYCKPKDYLEKVISKQVNRDLRF